MKRREGLRKLTGREHYTDDLPIPGVLWGGTVRSPSPRGRIRELRFGPGIDWSEFVIVRAADLPGPNEILLIETDQPVLAAERVNHLHEPVVLLAHPSREVLRKAIREVEVVVDPEPPALDYLTRPDGTRAQRGADNVLKELAIDRGDVDSVFASAVHVVEGEYRTGSQEHVYLENQAMAAWVEGEQVVVQGSMQCPYYVHKALTHALGRPAEGVRVIQAPTGGGFGGKEDYPSTIAIHAALLALRAQRPVKIIYERGEDMVATPKRHPARVRHRTAVAADGRLLAQDIEVTLDAGAYVTLSPVVLSRAIIHAAGPYHCEHVRIRGRAVLTNAVPFGAFRGFGAPQTLFACERHMDRIARQLGLDSVELRRRNLLRDGQATATGQVICDGTDRIAVMERALTEAMFGQRRSEHARYNQSHPYLRRGIGFATFLHGAGFTGSGETYLKSRVHVAGLPDGRIEILTANCEMGQGALTVFAQIASEHLGLDSDHVVVADPDTARVPNSGPTVASRTAMIVGRLIERAGDDLLATLGLAPGTRGAALQQAVVQWHRRHPGGELLGRATYEPTFTVAWDDTHYRGDAYSAFAWATYVAEVEVDLRTFAVQVTDFVAVQEVGKVLNETLARGQIQGGVAQGVGWALYEDCKWQDGGMKNHQLTNYIIPTSRDLPPIRVRFIEHPSARGARDAKGIGELPMDGAAPAILNAVAAATGTDPCCLPLTPEVLMALVEGMRA
ncbi:MAG: xanthine dehydrogenase family protein molybdopterin-binding subunit [Planctomycetota bacterium]